MRRRREVVAIRANVGDFLKRRVDHAAHPPPGMDKASSVVQENVGLDARARHLKGSR
jgi:hypothetical protein